ncbi:DNA polymerase beta domain-containing protein [Candidatus Magnetobacterium bavaricum]|uniref:DNA polymerase beta domain-containing protein n=1 Tax=Candidatus Magnetobacterium bavaricum TaxID=29290 RepID=A0A0F3GVJ6_9BACT|nr:DNA polymerase beta domain-containing protein [Candidatus Magnetobacterium bavaricum]
MYNNSSPTKKERRRAAPSPPQTSPARGLAPLTPFLPCFFERIQFVVFAVLFGSFAEGRATRISDVDIGLYTQRDIDLLELGGVISDLEAVCHRRVDVVILNGLYKINPALAYEIVSKGLLILCRDNDSFIDFKRETFLYYLDTAYLRLSVEESLGRRIGERRFGERNYVGAH